MYGAPNPLLSAFQPLGDMLRGVGAGHLFVTAAGNQGQLLRRQSAPTDFYFLPAQLHLANMLVVGASGAQPAATYPPPAALCLPEVMHRAVQCIT